MTKQVGYNRRSETALVTSSRPSPHHAQRRRGGMATYKPIPTFTPAQIERFWEFANINMHDSSACWIWSHYHSSGYGRFMGYRAHRIAYTLARGPIPDGLTLDHLCRTTLCCNPAHLEPVTGSVNSSRGPLVQARKAQTHCAHGHEYTPENTVHRYNRTRECRACRNEWLRRAWLDGRRKRGRNG